MRNIIFGLFLLSMVQNAHAVGAYREAKTPQQQAIEDAKQALENQLKFNVIKTKVSVCGGSPTEVYIVEVKVKTNEIQRGADGKQIEMPVLKTVQTYAVGQADVSAFGTRTPNVVSKDDCGAPGTSM